MNFSKICPTHNMPILLICMHTNCPPRLLCLRCADGHKKHEMVSVQHFMESILPTLQKNRNNPEKVVITKHLNNSKEQMLNKLHAMRSKVNGLIGQCEEVIEKYFGRLFFSLAGESHEQILARLEQKFTAKTIDDLLDKISEVEQTTLGTADETQALIYANMEQYRQKVNEIGNTTNNSITSLLAFLKKIDISKPPEFHHLFSRNKIQKTYLELSDGAHSVSRKQGSGSFPMCLGATPFSPISSSVSFVIEKGQTPKSIALGVCLLEVVRQQNYMGCSGFGKGIYAIDQNNCYNYSNENTTLASWNHHDTGYNQAHHSTTDLVGWVFKEGDTVRVDVDYYNSLVSFTLSNDEILEEEQIYEMQIKLDSGPVYPFVSIANKGCRVAIIPAQ